MQSIRESVGISRHRVAISRELISQSRRHLRSMAAHLRTSSVAVAAAQRLIDRTRQATGGGLRTPPATRAD